MTVAKNMGRIDAYNAIYIGYAFGLRIEEVCRIRKEDIEKALKYDGLTIKGKGGQVRTYPVQFEVQKKALQYFYDYAKKNNLMPRDYVISPQGKGGVERQINSLENWMYANREKFSMKNRKDEIRDGKKPRSENITWHGLRHARAQIQYAKYKDETNDQRNLGTSQTRHHQRVFGRIATEKEKQIIGGNLWTKSLKRLCVRMSREKSKSAKQRISYRKLCR